MPKKATPKKSGEVSGGLQPRPPVVAVVGHVDHGKTTLLDYIRKANVAAREAGGITQAVGAYEITHDNRRITFIDTPGHEAFTAMRSRGAEIADLAILVVAADEGPKPQTREAIKILQETKTPFVVAFNKIDKAGAAGVEKTKADLAAIGLLVEGYGGQVSWHGISAKTGEGVGELLDLVLLAADIENVSQDPGAAGSGFVLEVRRDPRRGIEASVIIKDGTLRRGDAVTTATASGKVKILEDFSGKAVGELSPSAPALIIGFETMPKVGEKFSVGALHEGGPLYSVGRQVTGTAPKNANTLNLILKASDAGSLEALSVVLRSLPHPEGKELHIVDEAVGDVSDGDVRHASATGASIIGFKNRIDKGARILADAQSIEIITSNIVYDLSKAVEEFLMGTRGPGSVGELEILALFNQEKLERQLVGGRIVEGVFRAKMSCDILRKDAAGMASTIGHGRILELREKKNEITSAEKGKEIGVLLQSSHAVQVGDRLVIKK